MATAGRPESGRKELKSINLDPQTIEWFEKRAKAERRSFSDIVRTALNDYMQCQDRKTSKQPVAEPING